MTTLRQAIQGYYDDFDLGDDGGAQQLLAWFPIGPVTLPIPNLEARRQVLYFHDASHILSGYHADWRGEFEESGFEVGSGGGGNWLGYLINYQGFLAGLTLIPSRTLHAWRRGAESGTIYGSDLTSWLDLEVDHIRAQLHICDKPSPWTPARLLQFARDVAAALAVHAVPLAVLAAAAWALFA